MENLSEIKQLHEQVQHDIFRILNQYQVLVPITNSIPSKASLYFFAEDYRFYLYEMPMEVASFINSVNRLLETGYLSMVTSSNYSHLLFIKTGEYILMNQDEKENFILVHNINIEEMLAKEQKFSFSGEMPL
jgi:hypothetical protein